MVTASVAQTTQRTAINAKPMVPRTTANIWNRALLERDNLYKFCKDSVAAEGLDSLVLKSNFLEFPTWVKVETWLPLGSPATTERSSLVISINIKPFFTYEFEYRVQVNRQGETKTYERCMPLSSNEVTELIQYTLGKRTDFEPRKFRTVEWHFWEVKNEVKTLRADYLAKAASISIMLGVAGMAFFAELPPLAVLGGLLFLAGTAVHLVFSKRRSVVKNEGKPLAEPRNLLRVDSWQTVIFGAGDQTVRFNDRFFQALRNPPTSKFHAHIETLWYWGLDGKEERDQIVVSHGRAIVFVQIYRYGKDLYVGWDGHLNRGQWVEKAIASGIDRSTGKRTTINCVTPGTQTLTEYDVIDLSCLMEWVHAKLTNLCRQFLQELKIDQEIDFKVLRGERQGLVGGTQQTQSGQDQKKSRFSFRRTA